MLEKLREVIMYEGYTYEEACMYAGGGGGKGSKGGGTTVVEAAPVADMQNAVSASSISNLLSAQSENFDEKDAVEKEKGIQKKKLGTRGLQIPLAKGDTAPTGTTPASTGIQI